jgi:hypothetical protein
MLPGVAGAGAETCVEVPDDDLFGIAHRSLVAYLDERYPASLPALPAQPELEELPGTGLALLGTCHR